MFNAHCAPLEARSVLLIQTRRVRHVAFTHLTSVRCVFQRAPVLCRRRAISVRRGDTYVCLSVLVDAFVARIRSPLVNVPRVPFDCKSKRKAITKANTFGHVAIVICFSGNNKSVIFHEQGVFLPLTIEEQFLNTEAKCTLFHLGIAHALIV